MATLIKANGVAENINPDGKKFKLETLQGLVGGYIEVVPIGHGECAVCDEEGKLKGKPLNIPATMMCNRAYDPFVGDIVICKLKEI